MQNQLGSKLLGGWGANGAIDWEATYWGTYGGGGATHWGANYWGTLGWGATEEFGRWWGQFYILKKAPKMKFIIFTKKFDFI